MIRLILVVFILLLQLRVLAIGFSDSEINSLKSRFSQNILKQIANQKGVDPANDAYYQVLSKVILKYKNLKSDQSGFKLSASSDRDFLIYIVEVTQFFSEKIDGGLIHFYGFQKLYNQMPNDLKWAIDRSSLSRSDKALMLETLKAG